jgi:hypothetical protein
LEARKPDLRRVRAETASGAYYVLTRMETCGPPDGHKGSKSLGFMVSALGLEPRTL